MDELDADQACFRTPLLSPRPSDSITRDDHPDSSSSIIQRNNQQCMDNLTRHLEQNLIINYSLNNNNYESDNESDMHDQQPTEATDDSILPSQLQIDPVESKIDTYLHSQPSRDRDDICSPEQETNLIEESFSDDIAKMDDIYVTKPIDSSNSVYGESFCVPYTDQTDEISVIKQSITTITTDCLEIKKEKHGIGHIMISYNHSTKPLCLKIAKALKDLNYLVWIDQDNISGDILTSMASAVENAFVVLMAVNEQYYQSRYCRLEAEYSVERNKASIPMLMQSGYKAAGWLGLINGSKLYVDFSKLSFDEAFNLLRREIDIIRISLGGDENEQILSTHTSTTHSITTMNNSWTHFQNIHEWDADSVIEWLHRERLEIFQNTLMGFTGATLKQLYKMKLDSAPDYYRVLETLLPLTTPLRLFYNLTFDAALESLFSSSNQTIYR